MRILIILLTTFMCGTFAVRILDPVLDNSWNEYKKKFNKEYKSPEEENARRAIWEQNLIIINRHNLEAALGKKSFTLKMNQFGDLTNQEFNNMVNGFNKTGNMMNSSNGKEFSIPPYIEIPSSVDWRQKGYVTPVKDQGSCGGCWAFSALGSLEGQHFKKTGKLVSLSEQNLIDCSYNYGNDGCEGGLIDDAFDYIKANRGVDTEISYPFQGQDGFCKFNPNTVGATITGYLDIESGSESSLTYAIGTFGPISVAIDAGSITFQFYSSGIYTSSTCSSYDLNHGVVAVGYSSNGSGQDYYIVKNSWGTSWGNQGYVLMARNKNNMCGIATLASFPTV